MSQTPYPSCPAPFTTTLIRLAGIGMLLIGFAFCVLMIAATSAQAGIGVTASTDHAKAMHLAHVADLEAWENAFASPHTAELWDMVQEANCESRLTPRARARCIMSIGYVLEEMNSLVWDRQNAVVAGFCSNQDAGSSHVSETLEKLGRASRGMTSVKRVLMPEFSSIRGRQRRRFEAAQTRLFAEFARDFEDNLLESRRVIQAMYEFFPPYILHGDDPDCASLYGTMRFEAERERLFYEPAYTPLIGWRPLPPKEE